MAWSEKGGCWIAEGREGSRREGGRKGGREGGRKEE